MSQNTSSFNQVTVERKQLLNAIRSNKDIHDEIYADALRGYYVQIKEEVEKRQTQLAGLNDYFTGLTKSIEQAQSEDKSVTIDLRPFSNIFSFHVPFPVSHGEDYDRAIRMVEFSANDLFTLTQDEFAQYVMNDWDWKQEFLATNSMYARSAESVASMKSFRK